MASHLFNVGIATAGRWGQLSPGRWKCQLHAPLATGAGRGVRVLGLNSIGRGRQWSSQHHLKIHPHTSTHPHTQKQAYSYAHIHLLFYFLFNSLFLSPWNPSESPTRVSQLISRHLSAMLTAAGRQIISGRVSLCSTPLTFADYHSSGDTPPGRWPEYCSSVL